jgi:hypothetical protein
LVPVRSAPLRWNGWTSWGPVGEQFCDQHGEPICLLDHMRRRAVSSVVMHMVPGAT